MIHLLSFNWQRVDHQKLIDDVINNWTMSLDSSEVLDKMNAANVPVGLVYNAKDIGMYPSRTGWCFVLDDFSS
jgi:crotonobetainyl-CoA:carnitine CoA-transferase CaiB-like acyl-CoA transferase